ncbi:MAG TPA: hypothetical protein VMG08_13520 [Allosphingosinicella sp.]|nr:hypothetical protein [Allosphingosinicella sp.]
MLLAAVVALILAQASEPPPPPEVVQAAQAFGTCVTERLDQAEDGVRPEVIADAILDHCRPQQEAMTASHARWVRASSLTEREKARSLRNSERNLRGMRAQIIRAIRDGRRR